MLFSRTLPSLSKKAGNIFRNIARKNSVFPKLEGG